MDFRDYYATLGVPKTASDAEISLSWLGNLGIVAFRTRSPGSAKWHAKGPDIPTAEPISQFDDAKNTPRNAVG